MYKRILVPFDDSEGSRKALETAVELTRARSGTIRLVHYLDDVTYPDAYGYSVPIIETVHQAALDMLEAVTSRTKAMGATVENHLLLGAGKRLGQCVAEEARAWEADLVVLGSHGRKGFERVLLGSGAEQIVRESPVAALVVRGSVALPLTRILVGVDGSESARHALTAALQLARDGGGSVCLVRCLDNLKYLGAYEYVSTILKQVSDEAAQALALDADIARAAGVKTETCMVADTEGLGAAIAQQARDWNADLVVIGTHGRRGVRRALLGSGAEQIIREAPVSVLVIPSPKPGAG